MELLAYVLIVYLVLSIVAGAIGLIYWWPFYKSLRREMKKIDEENNI